MEDMEGKNKKPIKNKTEDTKKSSEKEDSFSEYFENLFENYPMGYSMEEILDEKFGKDNSNEKEYIYAEYLNYLNKKIEKVEEEEKNRLEEEIKSWKEQEKKLKKEIKEKKIQLLEEYKKKLNNNFIANQRSNWLYKYPNKEKAWAFWVAVAARKLIENYYREINKKPRKEDLRKLTIQFKSYYYNKNKS